MQQIVAALKPLFNELRGEIAGVRGEISGVRAEMHAEFAKVNERLGHLETDSTDHKAAIRRVAVQVSKLSEDVAEVNDTMATRAAVTIMYSGVTDKIDAFLPVVELARKEREISDQSFNLLLSRLNEHDGRIARLEKKPPQQ